MNARVLIVRGVFAVLFTVLAVHHLHALLKDALYIRIYEPAVVHAGLCLIFLALSVLMFFRALRVLLALVVAGLVGQQSATHVPYIIAAAERGLFETWSVVTVLVLVGALVWLVFEGWRLET